MDVVKILNAFHISCIVLYMIIITFFTSDSFKQKIRYVLVVIVYKYNARFTLIRFLGLLSIHENSEVLHCLTLHTGFHYDMRGYNQLRYLTVSPTLLY
jgi:hypothetical protein